MGMEKKSLMSLYLYFDGPDLRRERIQLARYTVLNSEPKLL